MKEGKRELLHCIHILVARSQAESGIRGSVGEDLRRVLKVEKR